tara:strand:+ start:54 stop:404 length:351 start_codon:yes stop_codon:yes gene_type:complete
MKKKDIIHPKLYFDFKNTNQGVKFFYYSNKIDESGKRLKESKLNTDITSFSHKELNKLNKVEYKRLLIYIERQERAMQIYLNKNFNEQYEILNKSLSLMYAFKNEFESLMTQYNES